MLACMYAYTTIYVCVCVIVFGHVCVCEYVCVRFVCGYVCVSMCVCMSVCVFQDNWDLRVTIDACSLNMLTPHFWQCVAETGTC